MSQRRVAGKKCPCGCGQAPHGSCRQRKAECVACRLGGDPYVVRLSRETITRGLPACPCGEGMEPVCLYDQCVAPGRMGVEAQAELLGRDDDFARRSEQMRKRSPQWRCPDCGTFRVKGAGSCPTEPEPCECGSLKAAGPAARKVVEVIPF